MLRASYRRESLLQTFPSFKLTRNRHSRLCDWNKKKKLICQIKKMETLSSHTTTMSSRVHQASLQKLKTLFKHLNIKNRHSSRKCLSGKILSLIRLAHWIRSKLTPCVARYSQNSFRVLRTIWRKITFRDRKQANQLKTAVLSLSASTIEIWKR